MSRKFLTPIDLAKNELQNATIQNLASAPSSPVKGQEYFDTTLNQFGVYNGTSWVYMGSGSGDVSSNTATSVDSEVALFNGTTGKSVKRATGTGLAKLTSGVLGTATSGTDYAPATSGSSVLKGNGAGGFSNAVSGTDYAPATATTSALKGNGSGGFSAATLNDVGAATADYSLNSHKLTNVTDPTTAQDAATKNYVDAVSTGLDFKPSVRMATTAALPANTYANGTNGVGATLQGTSNGALTVDGQPLGIALSLAITACTNSGTTVTATISGSTVGLAIGQAVTISGITGFTTNNPNGSFVINSVVSGTQFTYIVTNAPTGTYTSGGSAVTVADRILVKNETTAANNGIYTQTQLGTGATPYVLTRATDADSTSELTPGSLVFVEQGTVNNGQQWVLSNSTPVNIGTTAQTWTQFSGASTLTAGGGLTATGNILAVGAGTGIVVNADNVTVDRSTNGSTVPFKFTATIGDGSTTAIVVTDNLATLDKIALIRDASTNVMVECDMTFASNTTTFTFATAPASNAYKVVIIG